MKKALALSAFALNMIFLLGAVNGAFNVSLNYSECQPFTDISNTTFNICGPPYPNITIPAWNTTCFGSYYSVFNEGLSNLQNQISQVQSNCSVSKNIYELAINQSSATNALAACYNSVQQSQTLIQNQQNALQSYQSCNLTITNLTEQTKNLTALTGDYLNVKQQNQALAADVTTAVFFAGAGGAILATLYHNRRNKPSWEKAAQTKESPPMR